MIRKKKIQIWGSLIVFISIFSFLYLTWTISGRGGKGAATRAMLGAIAAACIFPMIIEDDERQDARKKAKKIINGQVRAEKEEIKALIQKIQSYVDSAPSKKQWITAIPKAATNREKTIHLKLISELSNILENN